MGQMKRVQEDIDAMRFEAEEIAIKVGWMERCEDHFELTIDDSSERGHAYARANWLVKNGKTSSTAAELKDALDYVERNVGVHCSGCENRSNRDD